jgi:hypothetical protein
MSEVALLSIKQILLLTMENNYDDQPQHHQIDGVDKIYNRVKKA